MTQQYSVVISLVCCHTLIWIVLIILSSFYRMKQQGFFQDETDQHVEEIKSGNVAMLVVIRVRPLTSREVVVNSSETVKVIDGKLIALLDPHGEQSQRRSRNRQAQFSFDFVYDKSAKTKEIYDESISNLLENILEGYSSTVLAYGATGCGKTYTMIGESAQEGISTLAMIDLLSRAKELRRIKNVIIRLSYIEIYNEVIKDLLISEDKNLDLREDPKEGILIPGVTQIVINTMLELSTVMKVGAANRSKETTTSNEASSRSHSILMVKTQCKDKAQGIKQETNIGRLALVDLAGSERAGAQKGARQLQGAKINRSLLALGNCIQVLGQTSGLKAAFIPYRESKLTRLLKQSLGGNCRTAMIVNISPFCSNWQQTHNALLYASRARNIKTTANRNVLTSEAHLSNYLSVITNLKRQNEELKRQMKGKNHSLPQLKSLVAVHSQQNEVERIQALIEGHFERQLKLIEDINGISMKIDKAGFRLYRIQLQNKRARNNNQKKIYGGKDEVKARSTIEELSEKKSVLENRLQDLVLARGEVVDQIKSCFAGQEGMTYLMSHYRQKKVEMELCEIKMRERRLQQEKAEKQMLISAFGEELKIRDRIIQEQKIVIQKNNIINRITYSKLNSNTQVPQNIFQNVTTRRRSQPTHELKDLRRDRSEEGTKMQENTSGEKRVFKKAKGQMANNKSLMPTNPVDASWQKQKLRDLESSRGPIAKGVKQEGSEAKSKKKIERQLSKKKKKAEVDL